MITFDTSVKLSQPLTHVVESFRHAVNEMEADGDTALWDALALANDQLSEYGKKFPEAKRRIICLSDGADNKSLKRPQEVGNNIHVCTLIMRGISRDVCICHRANIYNSKTKWSSTLSAWETREIRWQIFAPSHICKR